ncbi:hypothetical protein BJ912DRAFT_855169 [Pholiota molesta]|nr:hypothetical protein BJ912DRAFT_855169 [Pholiota molesta]
MTSTNLQHPGSISEGTKHTNPLRRPSRGGQDLSNRWKRLENSLRQKMARSSELEAFEEYDASNPETSQHAPLKRARAKRPEEPKPPADDECCMSGCAVCVYDLYEESLEAYKEAVAALRASLTGLHIPEEEWPAQIRPKDAASDTERGPRKDAILNAFEEMERQLALKHKNDAEVDGSR